MSKNHFPFRLIKARVAETVIKQLFIQCGYHVFDHGMEQTLPLITGRLNKDNSKEALQIRQMPDFVVQNPTDGQLVYLEVKYRASGSFESKDLGKDFHYKNAVFIVVSKEGMYCISYPELIEIGRLPLKKEFKLSNSVHFQLSASLVEEYEEFAMRLFEGVE